MFLFRRSVGHKLYRIREDIRPMQAFLAALRRANPNDPHVTQALDDLARARSSVETLMLRAERSRG